MLINILLGLITMAVCLLMEGLLLIAAIQYYKKHKGNVIDASPGKALQIICGVMTLLIVGNLAQIGVWAILFNLVGEFSCYTTSFYHSAVNFASLGYGDMVMSEKHRLLGPLEAVNGIVMIGVSTAVVMSVFQDVADKKMK